MLHFISKIGLLISVSNYKISNKSLNNIAEENGKVNRDIIKLHTLIVCSISKECKYNLPKTEGTSTITFGKYLFTFIFRSKALYSGCNILKETGKDKSRAWYLIKSHENA